MGKWKVANISEMASRRAKRSEIWASGYLVMTTYCMSFDCLR